MQIDDRKQSVPLFEPEWNGALEQFSQKAPALCGSESFFRQRLDAQLGSCEASARRPSKNSAMLMAHQRFYTPQNGFSGNPGIAASPSEMMMKFKGGTS